MQDEHVSAQWFVVRGIELDHQLPRRCRGISALWRLRFLLAQEQGRPCSRSWGNLWRLWKRICSSAQPSFMYSVAQRFNADGLPIRFDQVRYPGNQEKLTDAALQVAPSHTQEEEMRVVISFPDVSDPDDHRRKGQIRKRASL